MKRLFNVSLCIPLLACLFVASPSIANESMKDVRELIANVKLANAKKYLRENPGAPDALEGINMVLEAQQELQMFTDMTPYLMQRYEIYTRTPNVKLSSIVNATASPIYSLLRQQRKGDEAETFKAKALQDFPQYNAQLSQAFAQVEKAYSMPKVGAQMANLAFQDLMTGNPVQLAQYKGHVVLLDFWISKCDICKAERVHVKAALEAFRPKGFQVLGFSQDEDLAVLLKYLQDEKIDWPTAVDIDPKNRWAQRLNLVGVPTNFLLDHTGKIVAVNVRGPALVDKVEELINAAPSAEPVEGTPLTIGQP